MIRSIRQPNSAWRHVSITLAVLALALKIIIPPGFMPAAATADTLPFALVLCTGQGAVTVQAGQALPVGDKPAPLKPAHESPCAFAGQALATPPLSSGRSSSRRHTSTSPYSRRALRALPQPAA